MLSNIRPKALKSGDTIGVIAPSSPVSSDDVVYNSMEWIQKQGFKTVPGKSCFQRVGYLSGNDGCRAYDVNSMFADPDIDGIICLKGGYGTPRILDLLDYGTIARNPKVFMGYSDITALLIAICQRCDMTTFHGPMLACFPEGGIDDFTLNSMMNLISSTEPIGKLANPDGVSCVETLVGGVAVGEIIGGNLSLVSGLVGTPYQLEAKGKLLLLEDVNEEEYRVDRMLTQLRLAGVFDQVAGIILGTWSGCHSEKGYPGNQTLDDVINDVVKPAGKPTIKQLQVGHCSPIISLPFGVKTRLDADHGIVEVLDPACQ